MSAGFDGSNASVPPDPSMLVAPSAVETSVPERVIESLVLGDTVIPAESLYTFPEGMHGFESHREFALVPCERPSFWWLQATDEPGLAFLLVDPFVAHAGYEVDLGAGDEKFLGLTNASDALVLTVVTLPAAKGQPATTNLRGPLVFNTAQRRARQIVSNVESYSLHATVNVTPRDS